MKQKIPKEILEEFEEELKKAEKFKLKKIQLSSKKYKGIEKFFEIYLSEKLPKGVNDLVFDKHFALWLAQNQDNLNLKGIKQRYVALGRDWNRVLTWLKKVNVGGITEYNLGELINAAKRIGRDDLVELFKEIAVPSEDSDKNEEFLGIKKFNKATKIFSPRDHLVYQKTFFGFKNEAGYFDVEYNVFKSYIGAGNKPIFIYTDSFDRVETGESQLYLIPLEEEKVRKILEDIKFTGFLVEFANKHVKVNLPKEHTLEDIEEIILKKHKRKNNPIFFEKTLAIPKEELNNVEDFYLLTKRCLEAEVEGDENIDDFYIGFLPEVNPKKIKPFTFMKSANHGLCLTNPGVKKTMNATIITGEPTIIDVSTANLLGFSTAERKISGKLDGRTKATVIDEMQEFKDEEVLGKTHTYMEQGECDVSKGLGIKCRGHSTLIFQGNPKIKKEDDENLFSLLLIKQFRDFLVKISANIKPFSRRIGEVEVGTDYKTVRGSGVPEEKMERGQQILRTIAIGFRDEFAELLKHPKINEWINKDYEREYFEKLNKLIEQCPDYIIKEFLEGQKLNFRHVRGGAIRRAWLQKGISFVLKDRKLTDDAINTVIETAELHLHNRIVRNLKSYAKIIDLVSSEVYKQIIEMNLKSLKPEYAKIMFFSLFEYKSHSQEKEKIIPVALLENAYATVKNIIKVGTKYQFFSRVKDAFEKYVGHLTFFLEEYGLSYDKSMSAFIINDDDKFSFIMGVYKKCKVQ